MGSDEGDERRRLVLQLAAESGADPRTVERWLDGKPVTNVTDRGLHAASQTLGLDAAGLRQTETGDNDHG